ncbi:MAG: hypothetical protein H6679_00460 [Epsilonproteobacteria bacterium]|nr:hypothetical protein [Campylobacterota bacterium]
MYAKLFRDILVFAFLTAILCVWFAVFIFIHGIAKGIHLGFLAWSFYVLCFPATHGRLVYGMLTRFKYNRTTLTEPFAWSIAAILNIVTILARPSIYHKSVTSRLLFHILSDPYPRWLILFVAAIGTFYRMIVGIDEYYKNHRKHFIYHQLINIIGMAVTLYLASEPLIVIFNSTSA